MELAPIALFVYKRPEHTIRTIESLKSNILASESQLIIFSDGPKNESDINLVNSVRTIITNIDGFKDIQIIKRKYNLGLSKSIISGVSDIIDRYGKIIVVEDDLVTSPFFLKYMDDALSIYDKVADVISVHGYIYPVKKKLPETFFLRGADCWGWATWKRGWDLFEINGQKLLTELEDKQLTYEFDFNGSAGYTQMLRDQIDGKNDSWAIRWYASAFLKNKLTLYPGNSLVKNIGNDSSGVHSITNSHKFDVNLSGNMTLEFPREVIEDKKVRKIIIDFFNSGLAYMMINKLLNKLKIIWKKLCILF